MSFLQTIVCISNSIELTNFIFDTNIQRHNIHLIIKMKVTLTDAESHRLRSNVTISNYLSYLASYYTYRHHTWFQGTL